MSRPHTNRLLRLCSYSLLLPGSLALSVLGACGGSDDNGGGGSNGQIAVDGPDTNTPVASPIAVQARLLDAGGTILSGNNSTVTVAIGANSAGGSLSGQTSVQAVAGIATFNQISIDTAGSGYTLVFSASGFVNGVSNAFNVVGPPAALEFATQPSNATGFASLGTPVVRAVDAGGNPVADGVEVTVELENNPGELILHASGIDDPEDDDEKPLFELVDPAIPATLHWLPNNAGLCEVIEVVQNPATGELHALLRSENDFLTGDPATGEMQVVGDGTLDEVKGAAFESGPMARLLAVVSSNSTLETDELFEIDPADGTMSSIGTLTPDQGTLTGFTGLAHDAGDDSFFGATKMGDIVGGGGGGGLTGRALVQLFPDTLTTAFIGDMGDSVSSLAVGGDGTLYAVTGDGATTPEALFTVDKATGAMTMLLPLGAGDDGEAIAMIAAQLRGTTTVQAMDGAATFDDLQVNAVATGYTLRATAPGLAPVTSAPFDISAVMPAGTVQFSSAAQTVPESVPSVTVEVMLDAPRAHDVIVTMTVGGTASGADGSPPDHLFDTDTFFQLTVVAGQMTASGTIDLMDDMEVEMDETIEIRIDDASLAGAIGAIDLHTVTLQSDD